MRVPLPLRVDFVCPFVIDRFERAWVRNPLHERTMAPHRRKAAKAVVFVATFGLALASCQEPGTQSPASTDALSAKAAKAGQGKIDHVVVIYLENHSFDNTYGEFQGAGGQPRHPH